MSRSFVIVGGGSAGCALANRLSADEGNEVLVLEAGRPDHRWDLLVHMPAAFAFAIGNPRYDWMYETEPEPHLNGRRLHHPRGKLLGGSSSINGMIWQRGNPLDFERWAADPGMQSWDYAHCLPYFKRLERCLAADIDDPFRGHSGPLALERAAADNPLIGALFDAAVQAGHAVTPDFNGFRQEGFARFDFTVRNGSRLSAARAYLHPVLDRPNLTVKTRALVTRILFDGDRAVGVEYVCGRGERTTARAEEVVLCGGAFNSPQLLQLSGVGNADELRAVGVEVVHDLPGVGENLQDHLEVFLQYGSKQPVSLLRDFRKRRRPAIALEWLLRRSGPAATVPMQVGGFARSNDSLAWPNIMLVFLPLAIRPDGSVPTSGHAYQMHVGYMAADSRGSVKIADADPRRHPALRFNYLSTEHDRREFVEAVTLVREIMSQPAFDPFNAGEISPGPAVRTDAEVLSWIANDVETTLHPCGTCKLGTDDAAVVDPVTMKVRGLEGLRIADASVFPYVPNANIYAAVMMVAEKAADIILGRQPLAPQATAFYRAGGAARAAS